MRRRWWITIAVLSSVFLVSAICWPQRGPAYQGRSLRVWRKDFEADTAEARWRSAEAVRHIGTNAVPVLIAQLSHRRPGPEPRWRQELRVLLDRESLIKINPFRPRDERGEALAALDALGPSARAAVPALERLLDEKPPDHRALLVLARIGPEAIPALTGALTNDVKVIRFGARSCLEMINSHSEILFPQTPHDAEFMRRTCQFNQTILQAAFKEYRSQHPEELLPDPDGRPLPRLPAGFMPAETTETNERAAALPGASAGFE
jgi:hypothetical protein